MELNQYGTDVHIKLIDEILKKGGDVQRNLDELHYPGLSRQEKEIESEFTGKQLIEGRNKKDITKKSN